LLFGIAIVDAVTYAFVIALVAAVVAIASYLPARRAAAAAANPLALLRRD
jgi:ABC-type lipoprotein release transport system permease subunit